MRTATEVRIMGSPAPEECCVPLVAAGITADEAARAAALFKSLSDPHRVRIVNLLANTDGSACVCDITYEVGLSQGTTSFHLKKLLDAGLLEREQRGTWAYYSLRREALDRLGDVLRTEGARG